MFSVAQIWKHDNTAETPMLGSYSGEWWADYVTNYAKYDSVFKRLYYSFYPFMQSREEDIDTVAANFADDVENILLVHDQELAELYRVQSLALDAYGLTDNYDMTETMDKDTSATEGARSDSFSDTIGSQTNTASGKVSPFDSENFYNKDQTSTTLGSRTDSGSNTKGAQSNSGTEDYTLIRKGNIGVSTATDIMDKHVKFWESFNFYHYVFALIARELLTVNCGGEDYDH